MARKCGRQDILVIAWDGAFSQETVTNKLNLPNASFILDRWHFINAHFGENITEVRLIEIMPYLMKMVNANSEEACHDGYRDGTETMASLPNCTAKEMAWPTFKSYTIRDWHTRIMPSTQCLGILGC